MHKILIVEDDAFLADLMQDCLKASDYDVRVAGSGEEALRELASDDFHVILLDWQLPDMDGPSILKSYRERNGNAKVVMLTGMRGRKSDGLTSGADRFLMKPFKIDDILKVVEDVIARV
jgi:DNA-binding response OmpR family regulator